VIIKHQGTGLAGVAVHIKGNGQEFTVLTNSSGRAYIKKLRPGDYWLDAQLLGINAAYECFHITSRPASKAKGEMSYDWGDEAWATKRVAGKLIDNQPGKSNSAVWNILHRIEVPIVGANLKLQDPTAGAVYETTSDGKGEFDFASVPYGIYVLHAEGGSAGDRGYDATDQLIALSPEASHDALVLKRAEPTGGSCGGTTLQLQNTN
jgi:hypothetical protein